MVSEIVSPSQGRGLTCYPPAGLTYTTVHLVHCESYHIGGHALHTGIFVVTVF